MIIGPKMGVHYYALFVIPSQIILNVLESRIKYVLKEEVRSTW